MVSLYLNVLQITPITLITLITLAHVFMSWLCCQGCVPNNSFLSEELGQVDYLISDKTGTLTRNEMMLRYLSVGGKLLDMSEPSPTLRSRLHDAMVASASQGSQEIDDVTDSTGPRDTSDSESILGLLRNCALNHEVTLAIDNPSNHNPSDPNSLKKDAVRYVTTSPDELALVEGVGSAGVSLLSAADGKLAIDVLGTREDYVVLHTLQFSSTRKRMSVLVRHLGSDKLTLFTKGADEVVTQICTRRSRIPAETHLELFAKQVSFSLSLSLSLSISRYLCLFVCLFDSHRVSHTVAYEPSCLYITYICTYTPIYIYITPQLIVSG